jgi:D-glycero-D-manno-heptose 1,7-bisphosphate phosphatase
MGNATVFLDRDDTLLVDSGYIDHPDKVQLVNDATQAVKRLNEAGFKVVVASNQSGVARGYFDESQLDLIHKRLKDLLAGGGAKLDGIYYCPFLDGPQASVEKYRRASELRKPAPGMLIKAARDLDLDLSKSWMIGDSARDVEAGQAAGCNTILLATNGHPPDPSVKPTHIARSLTEAVGFITGDVQPESPTTDDTVTILTEIRNLLDRQERARQYDDFSIKRLVASLVQMLVIVIGAWGAVDMLGSHRGLALTRFALAALLQLGVLTFILSDRRR